MRKLANYTGKKFKMLTVLECIEPSNGINNGGLWCCKCKCGKTLTLAGYTLHCRSSCGCKAKIEARKRGVGNRSPETVTIRMEYGKYKATGGALDKNIWHNIVTKPCRYCKETDTRNSILLNYYKPVTPLTESEIEEYAIKLNEIVDEQYSCCSTCKKMRKGLTEEMFLGHIRRILKNKK